MLISTNIDITKIIDENGFTLVHLAAYVNSDKCLMALFEHLRKRNSAVCMFSDESCDSLKIEESFSPHKLKAWINQATLPPKDQSDFKYESEFKFAN